MTYQVILFTDVTDTINGSTPSLGAYKCAHSLRQNGFSCLVVRFYSFLDMVQIMQLLDLAVGDDTLFLGFSNTFTQKFWRDTHTGTHYQAMTGNELFPHGMEFEQEFFSQCREKWPHLKYSVGGSKANADINNANIDFVMIGYSENSIVNLANHLANAAPIPRSYKNIWGKTIIDDRTASGYDFANDCMTWQYSDVVNAGTLPIEVGRGCVFRCKFCSYPLNGKKKLDFVKRQDLLKHELIENWEKYGITQYTIVDDTFNDHEQKLKDLAHMVESLPFRPIFWGYNRLDLIASNPSTLDLLHQIGLRAMYFGIETLHPRAKKYIGKGGSAAKQLNMIDRIRSYYPDITIHGSFIAGLPYEPVDHCVATLNKLLTQDIPLHSWSVRPLVIHKPGAVTFVSDIDRDWQELGYWEDSVTTNSIIQWRRNDTSYQELGSICKEFTRQSETSDVMKMAGWISLNVAGMNDPDFNFETVKNSLYRDFDFHRVETELFFPHVSDYYQKLLHYLKTR